MIPAALNDLCDEVEAEAGFAVHEHLVGHFRLDEEILTLCVSLDHAAEDVVQHAGLTLTTVNIRLFRFFVFK